MSAEALARIDADLGRRVEAYLDSSVTAPTSRALITDLLAALIPKPPTDDEREAIIAAVDEILNPFGVASSAQENLVLDAAQKWANRHRGPITDEEIEAAARAIYDQATALRPDAWDREDEKERSWWREHARVVLEAARAAS